MYRLTIPKTPILYETRDRGSLLRAILEDASQPLGRGFLDEDPATLFKHRDLAIRCPQIIVVEDPDIGQFAEGGLEIGEGPWVTGDQSPPRSMAIGRAEYPPFPSD
jgi:hypothetical protein